MNIHHTTNDRTPYTYLIGWSAYNLWYYGVKFAKHCHPSDLFVTYFTSCKNVKNFIKLYGNPDIIQIRKIFNNINKARMHEHKVLRRLKVTTRTDFINKSTGLSIPPMFGPDNPFYGRKHSPETLEKLRNRTITDETRKNMSIAQSGIKRAPMSYEAKHKKSIALKGKKRTADYIEKLKMRKYINDTALEKLTSEEFILNCIEEGLTAGKISKMLNVTDETVRIYARKFGIKFPRINKKSNTRRVYLSKFSTNTINKLSDTQFFLNCRDKKMSFKAIAKLLGDVSEETVRSRYHKLFKNRL